LSPWFSSRSPRVFDSVWPLFFTVVSSSSQPFGSTDPPLTTRCSLCFFWLGPPPDPPELRALQLEPTPVHR
jgi:hypothetical protein